MSIATCRSAHVIGLTAEIVTVEVDISNGLNAVSIVGLGDRAVEEAKDRISAAVKNSGYASPKQKNQKVVISLAPADVRKEGPAFDLAMALAYLSAAGDIAFDPAQTLFLGELSLEGGVRKVSGVLSILVQSAARGFTRAFVPKDNEIEASLASDIAIYAVSSLREVIDILTGAAHPEPVALKTNLDENSDEDGEQPEASDMRLIRGNEAAKRGLEIAAAGAHNILLYGPPGTGKTMLAQSFLSILPPLSREEAIEVTSIHSAARALGNGLITQPPFRAPHHTASYPAIVGGGAFPKPGEITLAHRGVLFLDEFPEFDRSVIEALRQPLEEKTIAISRARGTVEFPAQAILIASMNPCPCGKAGNAGCTCTAGILRAYQRRISGPIMDRLDIWVNVNKIDYEKLAAAEQKAETSADIRGRVAMARQIQAGRFREHGLSKRFNSEMTARDIEQMIILSDDVRSILTSAARKLSLSGRAFHRIIKVARTIADLGGRRDILEPHILEALHYRQKMEGE